MRTLRATLAAAALALVPSPSFAYDLTVHRFAALAPDPVSAGARAPALDLRLARGTAAAAVGPGVLARAPVRAAPPWSAPDFAAAPGSAAAAPGIGVLERVDVDAPGASRARVLVAARRLLGQRRGLDCSGFVLAAWRAAGISPRLAPARSRSESLYRATRRVDAPRPGDLAFFHDTYDRNRDGRANDRFSHVALVEAVAGDEVTLLHRGARGIERVRMDLARPSDPARNDAIRFLRKGERGRPRVLAGELLAGFGALPSGGADVAAR